MICYCFFAAGLITIYKSGINNENKKKEDDDMSLNLNADDWEYQEELLDIIDSDGENSK